MTTFTTYGRTFSTSADGGTLLLDEIGEVPMAMQAKLLCALQEQEIERIGDARTRTISVRIITAANRDLKKEIEAGRFRRDLFYRLSVYPILTREELKHQERDSIVVALQQTRGRIFGADGAAELLGMKPTTLASRIEALGIRRKPPARFSPESEATRPGNEPMQKDA